MMTGRSIIFFSGSGTERFWKFCEGRPVEELPAIVAKICGVCPGCHHMASGKAVDAVFGVEPPPTAKKTKGTVYMAHFVHSHTAHFYALASSWFRCRTLCPQPKETLSSNEKVGKEIGTEVIRQRRLAQEIQALLGGHQTFVVMNIPGGVRRGLSDLSVMTLSESKRICGICRFTLKFLKISYLK